ncbi:CapA family protein [Paenibacillus kandeliae]|uniref:CapA family protein n=1 Tax=Paenibacillus kandeliae TaxID=3231269 RepID=UPI00345A4201
MYSTRSEQNRHQRQEAIRRRKRRFRRWLLLNTVLVAAVVLVGMVYWMNEHSQSGSQTIAAATTSMPQGVAEEPHDAPTSSDTATMEDESGDLLPESESGALPTDNEQTPTDTEYPHASADTEEFTSETQPPSQEQGTSDESSSPEQSASNDTDADATNNPSPKTDDSAASTTPTLEPQTDTVPDGQTVTLHFGGDVMFSGKVGELLAQKGYDYPYEYVKKLFTSDDLTVVNLETPVTSSNTTAANKTYTFKSSPEALPHMAAAGIDAVNLANNHILDQGVSGLTDTIKQLDQSGVQYVGAGKDSTRAYQPVYVERKGIKIALLGFSRVIPEASWNAGKNQPGVATAYDATAAEAAIREAKSNADLVVVVAHWGVERSDTTVDHQTDLAHRFIDAGADLVVGGHPHVLQGLEQYKGKWIAYSTGNFIFTHSLTEKTWDTGVFEAVCSIKGECSMKVIPYTANLGQPVPMAEPQAQTLLQRLQSLSSNIRFDVKGNAIP